MSELTSTLKKAIPIIAVTWILSLVATLVVVYFAPNIFPKTWHEVARFEGGINEETPPFSREETPSFYVPSINWKIIWSVNIEHPMPQDVRIQLYLSGFNTFLYQEFRPKSTYLGEVGEYYLTGEGWWSIEVIAYGLEKWYIIVQAYY